MPGPILFIGDSITDAGRRSSADGLGTGWVRMVADVLRVRGETRDILNRGVGGDRVVDLAARWEADAVALAPSLLTVYIGINDSWRRYSQKDPTSVEDFESGYRALLRRATEDAHPELMLVEPFVVPVTGGQRRWAEDLDPKRNAVARLATEFGAAFVPLQGVLGAAAERDGAATIAADGVHPTPHGARLIAEAWLDALGSARPPAGSAGS
ncbi:MAG: SGNH/GDSL hydrolase family protein [Micrococcales bacterium]|nr:SGNH/GDSL hydrolase family protein [Micrococcales bacterium]